MTNGLKKEDSAALKGLAVLLLIFHHCYRLADRIERYQVDLCGLTTEQLVAIAECCKICVAIFAFSICDSCSRNFCLWTSKKNQEYLCDRND